MAAFCKHYGECGGCDFQETAYAGQLEYKSTYCRNLFASFGCPPDPIVASPLERFFRNKIELAVTGTADSPVIGQRRREHFDQVVDLSECPVFFDRLPVVLEDVRGWIKETGTEPYNLKKGTGELRYISLRHSKTHNRLMVTLVAAMSDAAFEAAQPRYQQLASRLIRHPSVQSVYVCLNAGVSDTALSGRLIHLAGSPQLIERVEGIDYIIKPGSFFQTNPACCAKLYSVLLFCSLGLERHIYDIYCGSGGITLSLAKTGRKTTGIDLSPGNISDAKENARLNKIEAEFLCQDADEFLKGLKPEGRWSMIVDPPRGGLTNAFIDILKAENGPKEFIYVSCNPLKLHEELKRLIPVYALTRLVPIDMFPHTHHIEVIALLKRRSP
jgi:23S rRNA (uracil1939-C5)-methyltransferase